MQQNRDQNPEQPIVKTATRARAGRLGRPVLTVLIAGIALVVLGYILIYAGFFSAN